MRQYAGGRNPFVNQVSFFMADNKTIHVEIINVAIPS